jgi:hypothetical protein
MIGKDLAGRDKGKGFEIFQETCNEHEETDVQRREGFEMLHIELGGLPQRRRVVEKVYKVQARGGFHTHSPASHGSHQIRIGTNSNALAVIVQNAGAANALSCCSNCSKVPG